MGAIACCIAFFGSYWTARKSLGRGILFVFMVGYSYGIFRAHFFDSFGYFLFDISILGLYAGVLPLILSIPASREGRTLRHWTWLLIFFPFALLFVPSQDYMIQLVGFRGNAFFLLFLLLGANLSEDDTRELGLGLSILNLAALAIGVAEVIWGIERFIPYSAVTDLIYSSHDVGSMNAYRIPATFVTSHSYGGQMVISLPLIIGTWSQPRRQPWHGPLLTAGILAAALGVFLCAARIHFIALVVVAIAFSLSAKLGTKQRLASLAIIGIAAFFVTNHERLQRFTTLQDTTMVAARVSTSVNASFVEAVLQYPMGNGLGGGGTSIPYFLFDRLRAPVIIESEYARIQLELGVFGLALWLGFLFWFFTRPKPVRGDTWYVGRRLAWTVCALNCLIGTIGIGLLTAIPSSPLFLLTIGWLAAPKPQSHAPFERMSVSPTRATLARWTQRTPEPLRVR